MATNYQDPRIVEAARPIYQTEVSLSQHYETLRASVTAFNIAALGFMATTKNAPGLTDEVFLILLAAVTGLLTMRLSHAHTYHFNLASKMRSILCRHDPKLDEKLLDVRTTWKEQTKFWSWLRHSWLWVLLNFGSPIVLMLFRQQFVYCDG